MTKVLQINAMNNGSTGYITENIKKTCSEYGIECRNSYGYLKNKNDKSKVDYLISSWLDNHIHNRLARITGLEGFFSIIKTAIFLIKIKKYNPDIIHLHIIHNNYINFHQLFRFIKKNNIKTVWTFHDCWPFTGNCPHFEMIGCDRWKLQCYNCSQLKKDGVNLFDTSRLMYNLKKRWFAGIKNLTIITPSVWLADLTKQSFMKNSPIKVINNGIDLSLFKPHSGNFKEKYKVENKKILLGVSNVWNDSKGLDVFLELAKRLDDRFQIVLVGTNDSVDKLLPDNIISIHRTENQKQLAEIYSAAEVFVNPTREENFPTVNIESLACGTPVVGFNTGGSPEIPGEECGVFVEKNDIDALEKAIYYITESVKDYSGLCRNRAMMFDYKLKFKEYVDLYEDITHSTDRTI